MSPCGTWYWAYLLRAFFLAQDFEPGRVPIPALVLEKFISPYFESIVVRAGLPKIQDTSDQPANVMGWLWQSNYPEFFYQQTFKESFISVRPGLLIKTFLKMQLKHFNRLAIPTMGINTFCTSFIPFSLHIV